MISGCQNVDSTKLSIDICQNEWGDHSSKLETICSLLILGQYPCFRYFPFFQMVWISFECLDITYLYSGFIGKKWGGFIYQHESKRSILAISPRSRRYRAQRVGTETAAAVFCRRQFVYRPMAATFAHWMKLLKKSFSFLFRSDLVIKWRWSDFSTHSTRHPTLFRFRLPLRLLLQSLPFQVQTSRAHQFSPQWSSAPPMLTLFQSVQVQF